MWKLIADHYAEATKLLLKMNFWGNIFIILWYWNHLFRTKPIEISIKDGYLRLPSAAGDTGTASATAPTASASATSNSIDSTINAATEDTQPKPCYPTITMNIQDYK